MRTENNHNAKPEAGRAKIPVNFIVIFFVCLLFLSGCSNDQKKNTVPPGYVLLSNEAGLFKWDSSTHTKGMGSTRRQAIDSAWFDYEQNNCGYTKHGTGEKPDYCR